jgi:cellulose synthase/poly-beta-1,6-N-acetylglucosamine synthase-like glycosyltransferase
LGLVLGDISDTDDAVWALARAYPQFSAHVVVTRGQTIAFVIFGVGLSAGCWIAPHVMLLVIAALMAAGFVANVLFRSILTWIGAGDTEETVSNAARVSDEDLPVYTVLVPVYREAHIVPALVQSLRKIDYPLNKLDVKIITEADDAETVTAAQAQATGEGFSVVVVPPSLPRTKPKACNVALRNAVGEYLVIYDAEDRPEPDQLRKAVASFRAESPKLACLQARLTFHNATEGWLAAMFTLDYELWFGFLLPGLARLGVPMPLGGTSNHFRTSVLREIKGWDPFNVTEDADLGIRLAQRGYRVSTLDSTTFEEATTTYGNWIRQRSRWMKGYMQTWLVHMRDPHALMKHAGFAGFAAFQLFIGGAFFSALVNPLLWLVFLVANFVPLNVGLNEAAEPLRIFSLVGLIAGNAFFTYLMMLGALRRGWHQLVPCGITAFAYWLLISVAAYRGLWQLISKPFYWEKTVHGLSRQAIA